VNKEKFKAEDVRKLQKILGYEFSDTQLLYQAFTHKSYSKKNNERLEFIGDAVLGYLVASMLYRLYPDAQEDALSLMRAQLVRGKMLAEIATSRKMADFLLLGSGELKSGGRQRASILADTLEAVIGAVHEDSGIDACAALVERFFKPLTVNLDIENLKDPKTRLQELLQARGLELPCYEVEAVSGADHQRQYTVSCCVPALALRATAIASSRRAAEKASANEVLLLAVAQRLFDAPAAKKKKAKKGEAKSQDKKRAKETRRDDAEGAGKGLKSGGRHVV
tara:strand:- start:8937 stop:9776 length:840 start_codon:yes stop_codon:yes gene_type:complete